jgi:hypothetical protein
VKSSFPFDVKRKHPTNLKNAELAVRSTSSDEVRLYEETAQQRIRLSENDNGRARQISYDCDDLNSRAYSSGGLSTQSQLQSKSYDDMIKTSWGMSSGNSGANTPWAFPELVGEGDFRVCKDLSTEERKAVLQERHKNFLPLITQWMPNTTAPGHDFTYEELAHPTKMDSARRKPESDGLPNETERNLRVHFASPPQVDPSAPRSAYIQAEDTAVIGFVLVAVSSEGFDRSFSGDEAGYNGDEGVEPPPSIMIEQPVGISHNVVSSVEKGKSPGDEDTDPPSSIMSEQSERPSHNIASPVKKKAIDQYEQSRPDSGHFSLVHLDRSWCGSPPISPVEMIASQTLSHKIRQ